MKHYRDDCNAHHLTFGGRCLNCGAGPKPPRLTEEERIARLRGLGFEIPTAATGGKP